MAHSVISLLNRKPSTLGLLKGALRSFAPYYYRHSPHAGAKLGNEMTLFGAKHMRELVHVQHKTLIVPETPCEAVGRGERGRGGGGGKGVGEGDG